jgi:lipoyl(octanoyl) transferase
VEGISCRILPFEAASGPMNMAADQAILESAAEGVATVRFYSWTQPTLSLGYFQPESARHIHDPLAVLPFVRRPTGGQILVHHHEVTYALALPSGPPWRTDAEKVCGWMGRMHRAISDALRSLEVQTDVATGSVAGRGETLCFLQSVPGDVLIGGHKIVGSAQRRRRGALLQHGAVLMAASPHAPMLPGIQELTGLCLSEQDVCSAISHQFSGHFSCRLLPGDWSPCERNRIAVLATTQYARPAWNLKR